MATWLSAVHVERGPSSHSSALPKRVCAGDVNATDSPHLPHGACVPTMSGRAVVPASSLNTTPVRRVSNASEGGLQNAVAWLPAPVIWGR